MNKLYIQTIQENYFNETTGETTTKTEYEVIEYTPSVFWVRAALLIYIIGFCTIFFSSLHTLTEPTTNIPMAIGVLFWAISMFAMFISIAAFNLHQHIKTFDNKAIAEKYIEYLKGETQ